MLTILLVSTIILTSLASANPQAAAAPERLRCEHAASPLLGLDIAAPRFAWVLPDTGERGVASVAHQVQVSDELGGSTVWDSGRTSSAALNTVYRGPPLAADSSFVWRVRHWRSAAAAGGDPTGSPWSAPFHFRTAPSAATWRNASYIDGSAGALRRAIPLPTGAKVRQVHKLQSPSVVVISIKLRIHSSGMWTNWDPCDC